MSKTTIHQTNLSMTTVPSLPKWQNFVFSSSAPMLAVLFTNPFDTAKVRLQLQGQMQAGQKIYRNSLDALWKIGRNEGLRGLQQGLTPAVFREGSKNLFRIGMFEPLMNWLHPKEKYQNSPPIWKRLIAGSVSGAMGALACNPFELIKTRMQARTTVNELVVGHQHNYRGIFSALVTIIRQEGFSALYKGSMMSVLRSTLGSGANLSTYSALREWILRKRYARDTPLTDMLRTRVFNQPKTDRLYNNGLDALVKVLKKEGPLALYKGFLTSFMRLGPHFALTFVFLEQMKRMALRHIRSQHEKKRIENLLLLFQQYDLDGNGKLDIAEVKAMVKQVIPRQVDSYLTELQYESLIDSDVQKLFKNADLDHSGFIEFPEFAKFVTDVEVLLREHELKAAFNYFDKNGDGKIDKNEVFIALKVIQPLVHEVMKTEKEYEEMLRHEVEQLMIFADTDHSGYIEFNEFVKLCAKLQHVRAEQVLRTWMTDAGVEIVH